MMMEEARGGSITGSFFGGGACGLLSSLGSGVSLDLALSGVSTGGGGGDC